jgi:virulence-associated protein VagC
MPRVAKRFRNGRSQVVRRPDSWDDFFRLRKEAEVPDEFMADRGDDVPQMRGPL